MPGIRPAGVSKERPCENFAGGEKKEYAKEIEAYIFTFHSCSQSTEVRLKPEYDAHNSHEVRIHNSIRSGTHLASSSRMVGSQREVPYVTFPIYFSIKWKGLASWQWLVI
jgi:hypothetical protein